MDYLTQKLEKRIETNTLRVLQKSKGLIDFSSNDYLGFSSNFELINKIDEEYKAIRNGYPALGATGSRLIKGNHNYFEELENYLASFHQVEAALIFNSGYAANSGLLSCIADKKHTFVIDKEIHASLYEGILLSGKRFRSFYHNDTNHLEKILKETKDAIVVIESLYSMSGSLAPLEEIADLCERFGALLIVDEAHATGVFGKNGEGLVQVLSLQDRVFARIHTFGKALGVHGAVVLGSTILKSYLINFCKPFIYSTAMSLHTLVSVKCAYDRMQTAQEKREHLNKLISLFDASKSVIQPIKIENPKRLKDDLEKEGFDVRAILPPTVKKGSERLRICLHAFNTYEETQKLCNAISLLA